MSLRRVTMADVARHAAVNKATVSRALKGDPRISSATSEKVWAAAKALGYHVDVVASGLSRSRTDVIGIVFGKLQSSWTGMFLAGVERVMTRCKLDFLVKSTGRSSSVRANVVQRLIARKVEGMIWLDETPPAGGDIPVVTVGSTSEGTFSVLIDVDAALRKLKKHFPEREFRFLSGEMPLFGRLADRMPSSRNDDPVLLFDDLLPTREQLKNEAVVLCGRPDVAKNLGCYCLDWPAFEMGGVAGRLLLNTLKSTGVRAHQVLVVPPFYSPEGELLS